MSDPSHTAEAERLDGLLNTLSGLGDVDVDKGMSWAFVKRGVLTAQRAEALYGDGETLASRLVDLPVDESTRRGFRVVVDTMVDGSAEPFADALEQLGLLEALAAADRRACLYGGAAILMSIDDGRAPDQPLDEKRIRTVDSLRVVDRYELTRADWYGAEAPADKVGETSVYLLTPHTRTTGTTMRVHESRLLRFTGFEVPNRLRDQYDGWGQPVLERYLAKLTAVAGAERAMGNIIHEWRLAVLSIKGLATIAAQPNGDALLRARLSAFNLSKSIARLAMIDADEAFTQQGAPVTGLSDVYYALCQSLSAISGIPVTLLYGEAPKGLSTDNKSGRTSWYDLVAARQGQRYRKHIRRVCRLLQLAQKGPPVDPDVAFRVEFVPLHEPTEKELAETREVQAKVDEAYWRMNVLEPEEIRISRFGGVGYSAETRLMTAEERAAVEMGPTDDGA